MFRIVETDNFGSDYPDEKFHLPPMPRELCEQIAKIINDYEGEDSRRYYKVVETPYNLQLGFEP